MSEKPVFWKRLRNFLRDIKFVINGTVLLLGWCLVLTVLVYQINDFYFFRMMLNNWVWFLAGGLFGFFVKEGVARVYKYFEHG